MEALAALKGLRQHQQENRAELSFLEGKNTSAKRFMLGFNPKIWR